MRIESPNQVKLKPISHITDNPLLIKRLTKKPSIPIDEKPTRVVEEDDQVFLKEFPSENKPCEKNKEFISFDMLLIALYYSFLLLKFDDSIFDDSFK